jgi:transposase
MAKRDDLPKTDPSEIEALIERVKGSDIAPPDAQLIERLLRLVLSMASLLQQKNASIKRLKRLIFGPGSDNRTATEPKTELTTGNQVSGAPAESERPPGSGPDPDQARSCDQKPRRPGHGRKAASAYSGAQVVICRHPALKAGDHCPDPYCRGHLYGVQPPAIFIQLTGQPLVGATKYEQEVLRCSACQERFTAPLPAEVVPQKYDASCDVSLALAKYGAGLPHYRIARLQASYGVPLPESVQFERCEAVADAALPAFLHLRRLAADGEVIFSDDTRVKILSCLKENKEFKEGQRRATNTTGMVIEVGGHRIALYANGRQHAGENLDDLLKGRSADLDKPIQMSDALAANWSGEQETVESKCLAHARRKFVEIEAIFPLECGVVLEAIEQVYETDAETKGMDAGQRLKHHQSKSGPVMEALREWIEKQFAEHQVEPNSSLGQALRYVLKHWEGLTRFLNVANAPLDNNPAERALKRAVLLRKNALFYKNEHGASVGAILLSLIETCRLNEVSAWAYLLWLMRHRAEARANPGAYLPWTYARGEPSAELEVEAARRAA